VRLEALTEIAMVVPAYAQKDVMCILPAARGNEAALLMILDTLVSNGQVRLCEVLSYG